MKDLTEIRAQIDDIDSQLLQLIAQRFELTQAVAAYKKIHGKAIFDPKREAAQQEKWHQLLREQGIKRLTQTNILAVMRALLNESKKAQQRELGKA